MKDVYVAVPVVPYNFQRGQNPTTQPGTKFPYYPTFEMAQKNLIMGLDATGSMACIFKMSLDESVLAQSKGINPAKPQTILGYGSLRLSDITDIKLFMSTMGKPMIEMQVQDNNWNAARQQYSSYCTNPEIASARRAALNEVAAEMCETKKSLQVAGNQYMENLTTNYQFATPSQLLHSLKLTPAQAAIVHPVLRRSKEVFENSPVQHGTNNVFTFLQKTAHDVSTPADSFKYAILSGLQLPDAVQDELLNQFQQAYAQHRAEGLPHQEPFLATQSLKEACQAILMNNVMEISYNTQISLETLMYSIPEIPSAGLVNTKNIKNAEPDAIRMVATMFADSYKQLLQYEYAQHLSRGQTETVDKAVESAAQEALKLHITDFSLIQQVAYDMYNAAAQALRNYPRLPYIDLTVPSKAIEEYEPTLGPIESRPQTYPVVLAYAMERMTGLADEPRKEAMDKFVQHFIKAHNEFPSENMNYTAAVALARLGNEYIKNPATQEIGTYFDADARSGIKDYRMTCHEMPERNSLLSETPAVDEQDFDIDETAEVK